MILNGSYNINFTMDLEVKDLTLFRSGVKLGVGPWSYLRWRCRSCETA